MSVRVGNGQALSRRKKYRRGKLSGLTHGKKRETLRKDTDIVTKRSLKGPFTHGGVGILKESPDYYSGGDEVDLGGKSENGRRGTRNRRGGKKGSQHGGPARATRKWTRVKRRVNGGC